MRTEAERQLAELVRMPTISQDIAANDSALDYLQNYLAARGMHCKRRRFKGHGVLLAGTRPDNIFTPTVLLDAHVDVVAGDTAMFRLRRDGDKLLGRGVYDMKFSIAGYLQIVDELKDSLDDYDFGIAITSDEEIGSHSTYALVADGLRPKVCIVPDSTAPGWKIETVAKGRWCFDLTARGRTAHGARPWEGDSASMKLLQALHELKTHFKEQNVTTDSINVGKIHGGHTYNVVPHEMTAQVEIRYLNQQNLNKQQTMIKKLCQKYDLAYREETLLPQVITNLTHPLVKSYLDSVQAVTGTRPASHISCATSDAAAFCSVGINSIISCCEGAGHHTPDEWISRQSFLQFVPILRHYLDTTAKLSAKPAAQAVDTAVALV